MPDYQKMYLHLFRETTKAIELLEQAQRQTEEWYIQEEMPLLLFPQGAENPQAAGRP